MASNGNGRNILVCVDESPSSDEVFEYCVQNFYRAGDVVHILHVIAPSRRLVVTPDMGLEGVIEDDEETKRKVEQHAQEFIRERFEKRLEVLKVGFPVQQHYLQLIQYPDAGMHKGLATHRVLDHSAKKDTKPAASVQIPFQVDILRGCVDNDSIGALVCRRAEQMEAVVVLMAKHSRGAIKEFFIGSVTNYAAHHCKQPVLVLHCD